MLTILTVGFGPTLLLVPRRYPPIPKEEFEPIIRGMETTRYDQACERMACGRTGSHGSEDGRAFASMPAPILHYIMTEAVTEVSLLPGVTAWHYDAE